MCNKETKYWQRERVFKKRNDLSSIPCFSFLVFVHIAHAKQQASQADRQTDRQAGSKQTSHHHQKLQKNPRKSSSKQASRQAGREGGREASSIKQGGLGCWQTSEMEPASGGSKSKHCEQKETDWSGYYLISCGACKL